VAPTLTCAPVSLVIPVIVGLAVDGVAAAPSPAVVPNARVSLIVGNIRVDSQPARRARIYCSRTVTIELIFGAVTVCVRPDGHATSIRSTRSAGPRPK
jgi:hypothetical protein